MATVIDRWVAEPDKGNGKRWVVRWRDQHRNSRRQAFERKVDAEHFASQVTY